MKASVKKFVFPAIIYMLLLSCSMPSWVPFFGEDEDSNDDKNSSSSSETSKYYPCQISNICIPMSIEECLANSGTPASTCNGNTPSSSSATVNPTPNPPEPPEPPSPSIIIKNLTVWGFSGAGGSFADLDAGVAFIQSEALSLNASKIDIVYDGTYIYTAQGIAEEKGGSLSTLNAWTSIIPLEGRIAQTAREVLSNNTDINTINSFYSDLLYYINSNEHVNRIGAAENTAFAVISSEENLFFAKISSKNGIESINIAFSPLSF